MNSLLGRLLGRSAAVITDRSCQPCLYQPATIESRDFISASFSFVRGNASNDAIVPVAGEPEPEILFKQIPEISKRLNKIFAGIISGREFSVAESTVVLKIAQEAFKQFKQMCEHENINPAQIAVKRIAALVALQEIYLKSAALVHSIGPQPALRDAAQEILKEDQIINCSLDSRPAVVFLPELAQRACDAYFSPGIRNTEVYQAYAQWYEDLSEWILRERNDLMPALAEACKQRLTNTLRGGLGGVKISFPGREILTTRLQDLTARLC